MERLCKHCKYWVSAESIPNWGNCRKNRNRGQNTLEKKSAGDVLRRHDENCSAFSPKQVAKESATRSADMGKKASSGSLVAEGVSVRR
jgi:hypothetical protein